MDAQKIAAFLQQAKPALAPDTNRILASTDLFKDGFLDSILNVQLIQFLETSLGKRFSPFQVTRKNFQSVENILSLAKDL